MSYARSSNGTRMHNTASSLQNGLLESMVAKIVSWEVQNNRQEELSPNWFRGSASPTNYFDSCVGHMSSFIDSKNHECFY